MLVRAVEIDGASRMSNTVWEQHGLVRGEAELLSVGMKLAQCLLWLLGVVG